MFKNGKSTATIRYNIADVSASRALFQSGPRTIPRVEIKMVTEDGENLIFELDHLQLAELIEHTMAVYNTIFPPLKTSRGGLGL